MGVEILTARIGSTGAGDRPFRWGKRRGREGFPDPGTCWSKNLSGERTRSTDPREEESLLKVVAGREEA